MSIHRQVVVLGAGISGLTLAHRLKALGVDVAVLDSAAVPGGVIRSEAIDGYLIERGPNSAQGTDALLALVDEIGLADQLLEGDAGAPAFIYFNRSLHQVPRGLIPLIKTRLLSISAKVKLLGEPFRARRTATGEESVGSFFARRLGPQVAERFVAPFMSGIYAGDANSLSVQAAFPSLARFEGEHGGVLRGGIHQMREAGKARKAAGASVKPRRGRRLCSFKQGMSALPKALAERLGEDLLLNCKEIKLGSIANPPAASVDEPTPSDRRKRFEISYVSPSGPEAMSADTLVIATPAFAASRLVAATNEALSQLLDEVPYPPLATASISYDAASIGTSLNGFGFLAVPGEGLNILGCVYTSSLFKERAPQGRALLTCVVGGARNPSVSTLTDSEVAALIDADLRKVLKISGEANVVAVTRYERSIPQYNIGHAERIRRIEDILEEIPGLKIIGNYLHGVSTGDCIKEADEMARTIAGE
jgi:oxygen-dependent protoporphyrinogen oxidase